MVEALSAGAGAPVVPILFPMQKRVSWEDTLGAARSGRTHEGNDLLVPKMTPLLAVVDGTLTGLNLTGKLSSYNGLPYYNILLRGDDGNDYFYIHLNNDTPGTDDGLGGVANAYAPGLTNGMHVTQGQVIGYAGDSGNAEDTASHLHFEIHLGGYKNPIDPYNSLKAAPTYDEWIAGGGGPDRWVDEHDRPRHRVRPPRPSPHHDHDRASAPPRPPGRRPPRPPSRKSPVPAARSIQRLLHSQTSGWPTGSTPTLLRCTPRVWSTAAEGSSGPTDR